MGPQDEGLAVQIGRRYQSGTTRSNLPANGCLIVDFRVAKFTVVVRAGKQTRRDQSRSRPVHHP
jgi:hypothetical protein